MVKKEAFTTTRPVRRVNLSLPVVRTDSYEIYYTVPPSPQTRQPSSVRPVSRQKPLIDINTHVRSHNLITTNRPPARLKNLTGSVLVNLFVDMPSVPTDASSTAVDSISNALINSGYSGHTLRTLPSMTKYNKLQDIIDDSEQSQTSSTDRLLYESVVSFDDPFMKKTRNGMWHNVHHPQFSTIKILHTRQREKPMIPSNDYQSKFFNASSSIGNLSQESIISTNDRLYEKVEHLTKNYFPSIQQLRHSHPCPELINNRMHLHREEKRDFVPILSRPRVGR